MQQRSILIVDEDDARRRAISSAMASRGQRYLDVGDAFAAMAALGRADFGAILAAEGRRTLSLRGLCQLARKRHPDIQIFVLPKVGSDEENIRQVLELPVEMLPAAYSPERLVTEMLARVDTSDEPTMPGFGEPDSSIPSFNPFDGPSTDDANSVFDSIPRVEVPILTDGEPTAPNPTAASLLPSISLPPLPAVLSTPPATVPMPLPFDEPVEQTRPDAKRPSSSNSQSSPPSQTAEVFIDGHFEDVEGGAGPALLMGLFSQDLTGRLVVSVDEGSEDGAGTLYLYRGEPVWADDPHGDAGLYRKLVQKTFLKPDDAIDAVPEGQLLGSLMQAGRLNGQQMHDFMREVVRDRVIAIAVQVHGTYRFTEDRAFLDTAPLLKVNPFGLIIDARRRQLPPAALMALGSEIEGKYVVPLPALQAASEKIRPFVRGQKASDAIDGNGTVKDFLGKVGLDPFMGSLVVVVMRDARLVSLEDQGRAQGIDLSEHAFTGENSSEITMVDAEITEDASSLEEAQAREDIYALYMRLKPLSQPRQVLGVGVDADADAIDGAYHARMSELDPRRIPEGSAQHLLSQRIDELRRKVTLAYQTLKMQSLPASSVDGDQNPF